MNGRHYHWERGERRTAMAISLMRLMRTASGLGSRQLQALALVVAATACQLAIDTDYTFVDDDAASGIGNLDPPPSRPEVDAAPPLKLSTDGGVSDAEPSPLDDADGGEMDPEPSHEGDGSGSLEPELPPDPRNGCSFVEYCTAYTEIATTAEELCRQVGCSLDEAIAECRAEIPLASICGPGSAPPYTIITLSKDQIVLN